MARVGTTKRTGMTTNMYHTSRGYRGGFPRWWHGFSTSPCYMEPTLCVSSVPISPRSIAYHCYTFILTAMESMTTNVQNFSTYTMSQPIAILSSWVVVT